MVERSEAYREAVADINKAVQNSANESLWDDVNNSLRQGIRNGTLTYDNLEEILPKVGISGDLMNAAFDRMDAPALFDWGFTKNGALTANELEAARKDDDNPLLVLAAELAQKDHASIVGSSAVEDRKVPFEDAIDRTELDLYKDRVRNNRTESLASYLDGANGDVNDGRGGDDADDTSDDGGDAIRDFSPSTAPGDLEKVIGSKDSSPQDRLMAAKYLLDHNQNTLQVEEANGDVLNVEIKYQDGMITLMTNEGGRSRPLLRGVIRGDQVSQQGNASYYGDRWSELHAGSVFARP